MDEVNNFDNTIIRDYNGLLLSKDEIEILNRNEIDYTKYSNLKELIYEIENVINDSYEPLEELEEISLSLSERNYYNNTNK